MATCLSQPLRMAIQDTVAGKRIAKFDWIREHYLDGLLGTGQKEVSSFSYNATDFSDMAKQILNSDPDMNGMRVYLASYIYNGNPDNDLLVPNGLVGKLALVFAPTKQVGSFPAGDTGDFYVIMPVIVNYGTQIPKSDWKNTPKMIVAEWVRSYRVNKLPTLTYRLLRNDTECLWYNKKDFLEFLDEMECRINKGIDIYLKVSFGAFEANEIIDTNIAGLRGRRNVNEQLTLVFTIMEDNKALKEYVAVDLFTGVMWANGDDYDTGVPCPPADGCTGGLLP